MFQAIVLGTRCARNVLWPSAVAHLRPQAVVHSTYPVLATTAIASTSSATPSGATCRTAGVPAVLPEPAAATTRLPPVHSHEAGASGAARTELTYSGDVQRLAAAAAVTAAELLRGNAASGGGRLAAATLAWLASLTAAGHPLRGSCGADAPAAVGAGREPAAAAVAAAAAAGPALTEELISELTAAVWAAGACWNGGGGGGGGAGMPGQQAGEVDVAVMRLAVRAAEACRAGLVAGAQRRGPEGGALEGVPSPAVASAWLGVARALAGVRGTEGGGGGGTAGVGVVVEHELVRTLEEVEGSG